MIAVSSNPSAGGSSLGNANTELSAMNTLKAMNDDTPHPGATDPARQHLIHEGQGDDDSASASAMDDEGYGMAMNSCGKGATCAPSPPPTWRAHEGPTPGGPTMRTDLPSSVASRKVVHAQGERRSSANCRSSDRPPTRQTLVIVHWAT